MAQNVLGGELYDCSIDPVTGWLRDGCCNTDAADVGVHTVCAVMTDEFLAFSKSVGNDLSTPMPDYGFPGLKAGDRWCLCASAGWRRSKPMLRRRSSWKQPTPAPSNGPPSPTSKPTVPDAF